MRKKLTIEFIRSSFDKDNYNLLTKEYINSYQKLEYICPNGHRHSITWAKWSIGRRCPYCAGNNRLSIEFISKEFAKEGYRLITTKYKNNRQKLEYVCSKGHIGKITWKNWIKGIRCRKCYFSNCKTKFNVIKIEIENENYRVLTDDNFYLKTGKIKVECDKKHKSYFTTLNKWRAKYRCKICGYQKLANLYKYDFSYIKKNIEKYNYKLLSGTYNNAFSELKVMCPKGHIYTTKWNYWKSGNRCPECARLNNCGSNNSNWKGGISKEPYCRDWTNDLKDFVKERDEYKCLNPDCWGKDKTLSVHHINYNKKSCGIENLITVCRSCNTRANTDREWHEAWYKAILYRRYNYIY